MVGNLILFAVAGAALCGLLLLACGIAGVVGRRLGRSPGASLLLVVHNQAPVIEGIIREILAYYNGPLPFFELVVVDDCSDDETPEILKRLCRKYQFKLIQMKHFRQAKPEEVGLWFCRGDVVYSIPLRGEVDPRAFARLVDSLRREERRLPVEAGGGVTPVKRVVQV